MPLHWWVAALIPDLVERGLHAGQLVKAVAQAGGKDVSKVGDALQIVPGLVAEHLG
jgi:hypothetical protein